MIPGASVAQSAIGYFTSLSIDISVVVVFAVILTGVGLHWGRGMLVTLLLSVFTGTFLSTLLPPDTVPPLSEYYIFAKYEVNALLLLLVFSGVSYIVFINMFERDYQDLNLSSILLSILLALAIPITLLAGLHLTSGINSTTPPTILDSFFNHPTYLFAWFLATLGLLYVSTR